MFRDVKIRVLEDQSEYGKSDVLNNKQIDLLRTTHYASNFSVEAFCRKVYTDGREIKDYNFVYYISVIPEKEASYKTEKIALINYLKKNSQPTIAKVKRGNLKSGIISFTVTKNGLIINVNINSTCGYPSVDKKMLQLMTELPGEWNIASNGKGEKIDQTFIFSFGSIDC